MLWQDPREFSDDGSEDSGFEDSLGGADRKKEQRLENDKYDMALEVSFKQREARLGPLRLGATSSFGHLQVDQRIRYSCVYSSRTYRNYEATGYRDYRIRPPQPHHRRCNTNAQAQG